MKTRTVAAEFYRGDTQNEGRTDRNKFAMVRFRSFAKEPKIYNKCFHDSTFFKIPHVPKYEDLLNILLETRCKIYPLTAH
jgi:hypothetical protein